MPSVNSEQTDTRWTTPMRPGVAFLGAGGRDQALTSPRGVRMVTKATMKDPDGFYEQTTSWVR
jgi:hypothetical protein